MLPKKISNGVKRTTSACCRAVSVQGKTVLGFKVLEKKEVIPLVNGLIEITQVVGPVAKEDKYIFAPLTKAEDLRLEYDTTILPPKKFFLPPQETLIKFDTKKETEVIADLQQEPFILFGLHPCDIKAIQLLDWLMGENNLDTNYFIRRNAATIIGVDCLPHPECFCSSVDSMTVDDGFDLFLTDIGDNYLVTVGTPKGLTLLSKYARTKNVVPQDISKLYEFRENKMSRMKQPTWATLRDPEATFVVPLHSGKAIESNSRLNRGSNLKHNELSHISTLLDRSYEHPIWEELGKKCLGCGSCNAVCPTCFCFNVQDKVSLDITDGERYRKWDGCMLEDFALVATGENFRKDRKNRIRHRVYRKYKYLPDNYGKFFCVGCGRCIQACLAKINPVEVINKLFTQEEH